MKSVVGVALIVLGIVVGLYVGFWVMFIGGIIQIINGITPVVVAKDIAIGVARIVGAGLVGWLSAMIFVATGYTLIIK
jgi:hypothetical protein